MPTALTFPLHPKEAAALPPYPGRALHALFYQWLALGDYGLSVQVHQGDGPRPFTVAPLRRIDGHVRLSLTLLDDTLWPALQAGIAMTPTVEVMGCPLALPPAGPRVEHDTYASLRTAAADDTRIQLHFLSPTSFRSRDMHFPLPDPILVYQSWLSRWNQFAPEAEQINVAVLDVVAAHVAIGRYELRTAMADLGEKRKMVGFVGAIQYNVLRADRIDVEWIRRLNILADYAPFCGTGHKTTQGMGWTERLR